MTELFFKDMFQEDAIVIVDLITNSEMSDSIKVLALAEFFNNRWSVETVSNLVYNY